MKTIYAIYDRKTNSCALCKEASSLPEFERWFATVFLRSDSMFALYPKDYDIYSVCTFDDEHMTMLEEHVPSLIASVDALFDIFNIPRPTSAQSGE
nr:MAG TPA: DNA binding protein [Microviridae sp.]